MKRRTRRRSLFQQDPSLRQKRQKRSTTWRMPQMKRQHQHWTGDNKPRHRTSEADQRRTRTTNEHRDPDQDSGRRREEREERRDWGEKNERREKRRKDTGQKRKDEGTIQQTEPREGEVSHRKKGTYRDISKRSNNGRGREWRDHRDTTMTGREGHRAKNAERTPREKGTETDTETETGPDTKRKTEPQIRLETGGRENSRDLSETGAKTVPVLRRRGETGERRTPEARTEPETEMKTRRNQRRRTE
jgi:hypothetical protein